MIDQLSVVQSGHQRNFQSTRFATAVLVVNASFSAIAENVSAIELRQFTSYAQTTAEKSLMIYN